jgi:hypothetical protein
LALAGMIGGVLLSAPGTAQAASTCAGTKIDQLSIPGGYGVVQLYYSNGNNCVMTRQSFGDTNVRRVMEASIKLSSSNTWKTDEGLYYLYAGPVTISAASQCVDWGGGVLDHYAWKLNSHCG